MNLVEYEKELDRTLNEVLEEKAVQYAVSIGSWANPFINMMMRIAPKWIAVDYILTTHERLFDKNPELATEFIFRYRAFKLKTPPKVWEQLPSSIIALYDSILQKLDCFEA